MLTVEPVSFGHILEVVEQIEEIDETISQLNQELYENPSSVKTKVDEILKQKEYLLEGHISKIELLNTKAKAFWILGDTQEAEKIFNKTDKYIIEKINFSDNEIENNNLKQKGLIESSKEKLGFYIENYGVYLKDENKSAIDKNKVKLFEQYFEKEIEKLEKYKSEDIGIYYFGLFYSALGDPEKAIEKIEDASLLGNKEAIETYTTMVIDIFLNQIDISDNKQEFIDKNLDNIEEVLFQFIDDYYYSEKGEKKELIQGGNKHLYEKIGNFYSDIGKFSKAIDAYKNGIKSGYPESYLLFGKVAELYKKYKYENQDIKNTTRLIKDNYKYLLNNSQLVGDIENTALSLEKLGDLTKTKEEREGYYSDSLDALINSHYHFKGVEKNIYRLMNKLNINSFLIKNEEGDFIIDQLDVLQKIISEDPDYLIVLASKYEEEGNIEYAFYNYLKAYKLNTKNSKDALGFFIDTSLRNFIKEEKDKFLNDFKQKNLDTDNSEITEAEKLNNEEFEIKLELLKRILKVIDKNEELERETIVTLFDFSISEDFYNNLNIENIDNFLNNYKNKDNFSDIFLHRVLENIFSGNGTNIKSEDVKKLLRKIYTKKELGKSDLDLIYNLLDLK